MTPQVRFCRKPWMDANLLLPKAMDGCESASAEGVGAWLARDLARSGSKP